MKTLIISGLLALALASAGSAEQSSFERIKKDLATAACVSVDFLSILESSIFESVDSADGRAIIAEDGRYRIMLGEDLYLSTGAELYSHSAANNQVTVEPVAPGAVNTDITLLQSLDESYKTTILQPDSVYSLTRDSSAASGLPDSLTVFMTENLQGIHRMEYYDINGELNRIIIKALTTSEACDTNQFIPSFPDSVEVIELF
jgi:outer membrane lipoprotein-sorting protein